MKLVVRVLKHGHENVTTLSQSMVEETVETSAKPCPGTLIPF
jgi:hypothetical protein